MALEPGAGTLNPGTSEKMIQAPSTPVPQAPRVATFDQPSVASETQDGGNFTTTSPVSSMWGWQKKVAASQAAMCCFIEKDDVEHPVMLPKCTLFNPKP
jgi:hypothetical protein